jgi:hypothetical protein
VVHVTGEPRTRVRYSVALPTDAVHRPREFGTAAEPGLLLDEADRLAAIGVTWLSIRLPAPDRAAFLELAERFGKEVIDA